jgi:hypothetical protein
MATIKSFIPLNPPDHPLSAFLDVKRPSQIQNQNSKQIVGIFQNKIGSNPKLSSLILRSRSQEYSRKRIFVKLNFIFGILQT